MATPGLQYDIKQAEIDSGLTQDQLAARSQVPTGQVISMDQLQPATPIKLPEPNYSTANSDAAIAGVQAGAQQYANLLTPTNPEYTQEKQKSDAVNSRIEELLGIKAQKGQEQLTLEQNAGIPDLNKRLADVQGQITQKVAESAALDARYQKDVANAEATSRSSFDYTGSTGAVNRQYQADKALRASELTMLYAQQQAVQGNLAAAQNSVNRAIDLKYSVIDGELDLRERQLDSIYRFLDKEEQKQADAAKLAIEDQRQKVQDQKENDRQIQNIMVTAAQSGASAETLDAVKNAKSVQEAISIAGYDLGADFRLKVAQQQFDNKIKSAQLAVSQANSATERARLEFDIQKEAFDQAQKTAGAVSPQMQQAVAKSGIDLVNGLLKDSSLNAAVGPNSITRGGVHLGPIPIIPTTLKGISGGLQNFISGVEQMRSQLNLQSLIDAKSKGATFGALSDQELQVLANSATKIGSWAIKDKNGKVTGYNASEKDFKKELDKINNFAKLDYILKGGNPEDVGVKKESDGTYTTTNSDGSITKLE